MEETKTIIDWEYYNSHFPKIVPHDEFEPVESQAELEYHRVIKAYLDESIPDDRKKDCIFKLCNFIYSNQGTLSGNAVTSVSNNGYSESYAIGTQEQAIAAMDELIRSSCGVTLAGAF